ncbi:hypothetical protein HMI54_005235 [Coelomomyces lativittatus]|nr:hypothetical protein HMI55_001562 [Coelomomyces lativittatus]KAJ1506239.1 hypothetical protein HMI54_005235 [Coelomomyces lativittatus]KAJ1510630.1 hypothetical protein HMI56_006248 [Coelomomyces lativittatus]
MKAKPILIQWHRMQSVTSVDFHPTLPGRLATAGSDNFVRLWQIHSDCSSTIEKNESLKLPPSKPSFEIEFRSTLAAHISGVNVVRWSPQGDCLASGDNAGSIILWRETQRSVDTLRQLAVDEDTESYKETWKQSLLLAGHQDEVNDLVWSPCGQYIASVGTDQKLRIWNSKKGDVIGTAHHHTEMVQGVDWDRSGKYIATQSVDRSVNIYEVTLKRIERGLHVAILSLLQRSSRHPFSIQTKHTKLYADPAHGTSFFRRLSFSPDTSMLITPAAIAPPSIPHLTSHSKPSRSKKHVPHWACMGYTQFRSAPTLIYPGFDVMPWCVRFAPFGLRILGSTSTDQESARIPTKAMGTSPSSQEDKHVPFTTNTTTSTTSTTTTLSSCSCYFFAVGTDDGLFVYGTQGEYPILMIKNFHLYRYQDVAWSCDGHFLVGASHDGYCTVVIFEVGDLGSSPLVPVSQLLPTSPTPTTTSSSTLNTLPPMSMVEIHGGVDSTLVSSSMDDPVTLPVPTHVPSSSSSSPPPPPLSTTTTLPSGKKRITPMFISTL